jgi:hypothetical protein
MQSPIGKDGLSARPWNTLWPRCRRSWRGRAHDPMTDPRYPHRSTITLSDLTELVAAAREVQAPFKNDTAWWRGHANVEWQLVPQVFRGYPERPERPLYDETALIGHFVSRAPSRSHRSPGADDFFGWLF